MSGASFLESLAILVGLGFFLGLAFEDFYAHAGETRPGGIRTFPLLALGGGLLYALDPARFVPFTAGLVVLGLWLFAYYRDRMGERDAAGAAALLLLAAAGVGAAFALG